MGFPGSAARIGETPCNTFRGMLHGAPAWSAPGFPPRSTRRTTKKANRIRAEGAFVALRLLRGSLRMGFNGVFGGCRETLWNVFRETLHGATAWRAPGFPPRSTRRTTKRPEDHTSELQSLMRHSYDVFRLK